MAGDTDDRLQGSQCDAHVGWVQGDAVLARSQDGVAAVEPSDGGAAHPRYALVAGRSCVVEIATPSPLHQITADRRHIAELRRCAGQDSL